MTEFWNFFQISVHCTNLYMIFLMHCRNHHSDSHAYHVINILNTCYCRVKFVIIPLCFVQQQYLWNITIKPAVDYYDIWANTRRSGCLALAERVFVEQNYYAQGSFFVVWEQGCRCWPSATTIPTLLWLQTIIIQINHIILDSKVHGAQMLTPWTLLSEMIRHKML